MWPWDFNVPVGCGGVLVIPGDIIIADDDGAVVVPIKLAPELVKRATEHEEWGSIQPDAPAARRRAEDVLPAE